MAGPLLPLSPHEHSAKLLPHHHTSFRGLFVVLTLSGLLFGLLTVGAVLPTNADSGDIAVNAIVPGPPPSTSPVITAPSNGSTVANRQLTVSGSCSGNDSIVVMDNGVASGSTFCDHTGAFSLALSLNTGANALTAHYVDNLNQSGPDSNSVTITYQPVAATSPPLLANHGSKLVPATGTGANASGSTWLTVTAPSHPGSILPGSSFTLAGNVTGGNAPYAIEIDWGDGTRILLSQATAGDFSQNHTYAKAGRDIIRINVTDSAAGAATFQTTVTVSGVTAAPTPVQPTSPAVVVPPFELMVLWPVFLAVCLAAISFWLGERFYARRVRLPSS